MNSNQRFVFKIDWYDQPASLVRSYLFTYFITDKTIEIYDLKNKRTFLKRCEYPSIKQEDLFIGATLTIYSRQVTIVDYGDVYTRKFFEANKSKALFIIKPDAYNAIGKIISKIEDSKFQINQMKIVKFSEQDANEFFTLTGNPPASLEVIKHITSDIVVGMEIVALNAIEKLQELIGPSNSEIAKKDKPTSIRALFGKDDIKNAVHCSETVTSGQAELDFFFGTKNKFGRTAFFKYLFLLINQATYYTRKKIRKND